MRKTTPTFEERLLEPPPRQKSGSSPGLGTRSISVKAVSMSAKNMTPKRQVTRSTLELEKGT
jgi:hypothetical protein